MYPTRGWPEEVDWQSTHFDLLLMCGPSRERLTFRFKVEDSIGDVIQLCFFCGPRCIGYLSPIIVWTRSSALKGSEMMCRSIVSGYGELVIHVSLSATICGWE